MSKSPNGDAKPVAGFRDRVIGRVSHNRFVRAGVISGLGLAMAACGQNANAGGLAGSSPAETGTGEPTAAAGTSGIDVTPTGDTSGTVVINGNSSAAPQETQQPVGEGCTVEKAIAGIRDMIGETLFNRQLRDPWPTVTEYRDAFKNALSLKIPECNPNSITVAFANDRKQISISIITDDGSRVVGGGTMDALGNKVETADGFVPES